MGVDSRDKRFSLLAFGKPFPFVMPDPDGLMKAADRVMLLFSYFRSLVVGTNVSPSPPHQTSEVVIWKRVNLYDLAFGSGRTRSH